MPHSQARGVPKECTSLVTNQVWTRSVYVFIHLQQPYLFSSGFRSVKDNHGDRLGQYSGASTKLRGDKRSKNRVKRKSIPSKHSWSCIHEFLGTKQRNGQKYFCVKQTPHASISKSISFGSCTSFSVGFVKFVSYGKIGICLFMYLIVVWTVLRPLILNYWTMRQRCHFKQWCIQATSACLASL